MAEVIEASTYELESSVLELNATERAEELTDLIQELSASHIQDWSDEKRDRFALKLSKQLEHSETLVEFPPKRTLQTAIDTLNFDGSSYLVCCYEFIPNKTKSSVEPKPYKNIGKYNLLLVWKTRSFDPKAHAFQNSVQVKAKFDGNDCFFPRQTRDNICVLHHRGTLRQDGKDNKGYGMRKYRLVEIIEDAPHAKRNTASARHPQPIKGGQRAEDIASKAGSNPSQISVVEQMNNAFPQRLLNGAGSVKLTDLGPNHVTDSYPNMFSLPLGEAFGDPTSFGGLSDDFGTKSADELSNYEAGGSQSGDAAFSCSQLDLNSLFEELPADAFVAPPLCAEARVPQDGISKGVKTNVAVLNGTTSGAQRDQEEKEEKATFDLSQMDVDSQSYPYEILPNDRFVEAVQKSSQAEVLEMIKVDGSVVNSCNSEMTMTALQFAAYDGRLWMVTKLLENGANPCPRLPKSSVDWARHSPLEIVTQFRIREEVVKIIRLHYKNNQDKFVLPRDKDAIEEFERLPSINESFRSVLLAGLRLPNVYLENYKEELSIDKLFCLGKFVKKYDQETNSSAGNRLKISYSDPGEDSRFLAIYYTVHDRDMLNDALMHWKEGASKRYGDWNCVNESCPCRGHGSPWNRSQCQRPKT